jgi:hypothetical protein
MWLAPGMGTLKRYELHRLPGGAGHSKVKRKIGEKK